MSQGPESATVSGTQAVERPGGQVHDPKVLRAIAHPVRNRILAELTATGPMRAADVARELDLPANQASFHLRQLAKYGLVVEAPEAARDGRDRVWRAVSEHGFDVDLGELEAQPGGRAASTVFRRSGASWGHVLVEKAYDTSDRESDTHRMISDSAVRLTKQEAVEFSDELVELARSWADRTRGRDDERRTYSVLVLLQTYPALADPALDRKRATDPDQDEA